MTDLFSKQSFSAYQDNVVAGSETANKDIFDNQIDHATSMLNPVDKYTPNLVGDTLNNHQNQGEIGLGTNEKFLYGDEFVTNVPLIDSVIQTVGEGIGHIEKIAAGPAPYTKNLLDIAERQLISSTVVGIAQQATDNLAKLSQPPHRYLSNTTNFAGKAAKNLLAMSKIQKLTGATVGLFKVVSKFAEENTEIALGALHSNTFSNVNTSERQNLELLPQLVQQPIEIIEKLIDDLDEQRSVDSESGQEDTDQTTQNVVSSTIEQIREVHQKLINNLDEQRLIDSESGQEDTDQPTQNELLVKTEQIRETYQKLIDDLDEQRLIDSESGQEDTDQITQNELLVKTEQIRETYQKLIDDLVEQLIIDSESGQEDTDQTTQNVVLSTIEKIREAHQKLINNLDEQRLIDSESGQEDTDQPTQNELLPQLVQQQLAAVQDAIDNYLIEQHSTESESSQEETGQPTQNFLLPQLIHLDIAAAIQDAIDNLIEQRIAERRSGQNRLWRLLGQQFL